MLNVKMSYKDVNVHHIRKNYGLFFYKNGNECINALLSIGFKLV